MSGPAHPRILVFSTTNISDPGIDLAGSQHLHYPASVFTLSVPCSSAVRPSWIVDALTHGFDGVLVAADGDECALLPDCNQRTSRAVSLAQAQLSAAGLEPQRVTMAAICSVCSAPFVSHVREFAERLAPLGPTAHAA